MGRNKRILLVSRDLRVMQTRKLMLGTYFEVYSAARVGEASRFLAEHTFHLLILCYSLTGEDRQKVLEATRACHPEARVLSITFHGAAAGPVLPDGQISMDEGPLALLKRSAELLGFDFRTRGRLVNALQPRNNPRLPVTRCA